MDYQGHGLDPVVLVLILGGIMFPGGCYSTHPPRNNTPHSSATFPLGLKEFHDKDPPIPREVFTLLVCSPPRRRIVHPPHHHPHHHNALIWAGDSGRDRLEVGMRIECVLILWQSCAQYYYLCNDQREKKKKVEWHIN